MPPVQQRWPAEAAKAGVDLVQVVGPVAVEGAVTVKLLERLVKIGAESVSVTPSATR